MSDLVIDYVEVGGRIRNLRKETGKTQRAFADRLGVSTSYMALIESGKRKPTIEILIQIAQMCGVSIDYIIFGEGGEEQEDVRKKTDLLFQTHSPEEVERALRLAEYYLNL